MCGFCNVWLCVCGFCNVWVCVCVGFVMCGCVYVSHKNKEMCYWVDHILRRNLILKHVTEGNINGRISDGRTSKMT